MLVIDVIGRYQWPVPLKRKLSFNVARELTWNTVLGAIQYDQGAEFEDERLCNAIRIK